MVGVLVGIGVRGQRRRVLQDDEGGGKQRPGAKRGYILKQRAHAAGNRTSAAHNDIVVVGCRTCS